jgi:hypothetical protein
MDKEAKNSILGAICLIALTIVVLSIMNYHASGWDRYFGIQSVGGSFFADTLYLLGAVGLAVFVSFLIWRKASR